MFSKKVIVKSVTGLHARPGTKLVELANNYTSDIILVKKDGTKVNAKEVFEVLAANVSCGDELTVETNGTDAETALKAVADYIETCEG